MTSISPFILLTSGGYKWTSGHGKWFIYLFHKLDVCLQVSNVFVIQMKKKGTGLSLSMKQASGQDTYFAGAKQATSPTGASVAESRKRPRDRPKRTEEGRLVILCATSVLLPGSIGLSLGDHPRGESPLHYFY